MRTWFEGTGEIATDLRRVGDAFRDPGELYAAVVDRMPGMTNVELVDQDPGRISIRTNEGLMTRSGLVADVARDAIVVEFDEEYQAGSRVTVTSHTRSEFVSSDIGVRHHLVIGDVTAPGLLGFFYRRFGASKMGRAILDSHRTYFENA